MSRVRMSRRGLLKSAAAIPFALPMLQALDARADDGVFPTRFVVMFCPNGTIPDEWFPTPGVGGDADFTLKRIHQPLLPYQNRLLLLKGLNLAVGSAPEQVGEQHQTGMGGLLTGTIMTPAYSGAPPGGTGVPVGWASGPSIDQRIAEEIGAGTRLKSLQLGIRTDITRSEARNRLNFAGRDQPIPPVDDPQQTFNTLFGMTNPDDVALRKRRRVSVLDAVQTQFTRLNARLPSADRDKLEAHLTLVRELETRIAGASTGMTCASPAAPAAMDAQGENNMPLVSRNQIDLLVSAFKCDLTRVGTLQYSSGINAIRLPFIDPYSGTGHDLSHIWQNVNGNEQRELMIVRQTWFAQQLRYLMDQLAGVPEGTGSMLDHTIILWCNEVATGNDHSHNNMPFLVAGSPGGPLHTGRYLQLTSQPHNNLLVSLLNAFGVNVSTWGDTRYCTGPIAGMLA